MSQTPFRRTAHQKANCQHSYGSWLWMWLVRSKGICLRYSPRRRWRTSMDRPPSWFHHHHWKYIKRKSLNQNYQLKLIKNFFVFRKTKATNTHLLNRAISGTQISLGAKWMRSKPPYSLMFHVRNSLSHAWEINYVKLYHVADWSQLFFKSC